MPDGERRFYLGGMWVRQTAVGRVISGRFVTSRLEEGVRVATMWGTLTEVVLFENRNKRTDRHPDFIAYLVPVRRHDEVQG